MLRVTVETRTAMVESPAEDADYALAEAVHLIRSMTPLSHRRETFVQRVSNAIRTGTPIRLRDDELGITICVQ